jgi:xylan 1,4-beta-xylosidase
MTQYPNPLVSGFNPDPSIVRGPDGAYYVVTSTFEYLPGIPVYRSYDLVDWVQVGNVVTRDSQLDLSESPTLGGVWAPTIRYHDGLFYLIVVVAMGPGCLVFTTDDPAGEWSEPLKLPGISGIDPDLAWDDAGNVYVTFSGLATTGENMGQHLGIQQVRVDLASGENLEEPRSLWSGTGLKFPEAPHLYQRDGWWYLLIAEGGTERGHSASIARSTSPEGPFEGFVGNPFLSNRSTSRPIQNTGHADFFETPDGGSALVLLGMRPRGLTQSFSALGRETFVTNVTWVDGWPVAEPVELRPRDGATTWTADFSAPELDDGWLAIRTHPSEVATVSGGRLALHGTGATMSDAHPAFIGRRLLNQTARLSTTVDAANGTGGLVVRYDEEHHVEIEITGTPTGNEVVGRMTLSGLTQSWTATLPAGEVEAVLEFRPVEGPFGPAGLSSDRIILTASAGGESAELANVDGRYLSAETSASFTGRVLGLYAVTGEVTFGSWDYSGSED